MVHDSSLSAHRFQSSMAGSQGPQLCPSTFRWATTNVAGTIGMRRMSGRWMPTLTTMISPTMSSGST